MQLAEKEKRLVIVVSTIVVVCVGGPTFAQTYSAEYQLAKTNEVRNLQAEIDQYESNIAGIDEQRELLRANRQDYLRLVDEGVVGKQNAIRWVELMQEIQTARGLFPTNMEWSEGDVVFAPDDSPLTADSTVSIVFRTLEFEMPMLHDMDVLMFLSDLQRQSSSFFFPVECIFDRVTNDFELVRRENMLATCTIEWVSVQDPDSNVLEDSSNESDEEATNEEA